MIDRPGARGLPVLDLPNPRVGKAAAPATRPPLVDGRLEEYLPEPQALPRFFLWTLGCQMNRSDSEEMAGRLLAAGCDEASELEAADLVVINTCAIREAAEQKVIGRQGYLGRLKAANPGLRIVLTGCAVREEERSGLARRYPAVDMFLRPDEEPELVDRLGLASAQAPIGSVGSPDSLGSLGRAGAVGATTTVGRHRVGVADGLAHTRATAVAGYREVTLLGQNVNSYGHDLAPDARFRHVDSERWAGRRLDLHGRPDLAELIRAIDGLRTADGLPAISRLRFVTSHPWDLSDRLIAAMAACPSVCEHLHLPVQSGDDAVLRRMGRQYTIEHYLERLASIRESVPGIAISTDVIVGFCGETEAQFEATLDLLRSVRYDQVFAAAFSPRPGTPAAKLPDDVPPADKRRRLNQLLALQESIGLERNRGWQGETVEVLVDSVVPQRSHDHDHEAGDAARAPLGVGEGQVHLAGRSRHNKLVHVAGAAQFVGQFVRVRVEHASPYALRGTLA